MTTEEYHQDVDVDLDDHIKIGDQKILMKMKDNNQTEMKGMTIKKKMEDH